MGTQRSENMKGEYLFSPNFHPLYQSNICFCIAVYNLTYTLIDYLPKIRINLLLLQLFLKCYFVIIVSTKKINFSDFSEFEKSQFRCALC